MTLLSAPKQGCNVVLNFWVDILKLFLFICVGVTNY